MTCKFFSRFVGGVFVLAMAPLSWAHAFDEMNATFYMETKKEVSLYLASEYPNGDRALVSHITIPEESILAVDIEDMNSVLTINKNNPDRLKYPFVRPGTQDIQRPETGWICGVRVVDVSDEDLRESDTIERSDFCMSLDDLDSITLLESNGEALRQSFEAYQRDSDLSYMNTLANHVQRVREDREAGIVEKAAGAALTMTSPLKGCDRGCLKVTSGFGMRKHPVYRKMRLHKGLDLRAATGSSVVSVLPGKVLATRTEVNRRTKKMKGYGRYVIVVHPANGLETLYAHLSEFKTKAGISVEQGDLIALSGNSGIGTGAHLHFETHVKAKKGYTLTNPTSFLGALLEKVAYFLKLFEVRA